MSSGLTSDFKDSVLKRVHNFSIDVFKAALYQADADDRDAYSATNEAVGAGYVAGGKTLDVTLGEEGGLPVATFDDLSWPSSTFSAQSLLIYNTSRSNKSVAMLNFDPSTGAGGTFILKLSGLKLRVSA